MTKAHRDFIMKNNKSMGSSIRIGKNVPKNSANLAYVYNEELSPEKNIKLESFEHTIKENNRKEEEFVMFPDDNLLLSTEDGLSVLDTENILLTDEFSIKKNPMEAATPLYYVYRIKGLKIGRAHV